MRLCFVKAARGYLRTETDCPWWQDSLLALLWPPPKKRGSNWYYKKERTYSRMRTLRPSRQCWKKVRYFITSKSERYWKINFFFFFVKRFFSPPQRMELLSSHAMKPMEHERITVWCMRLLFWKPVITYPRTMGVNSTKPRGETMQREEFTGAEG